MSTVRILKPGENLIDELIGILSPLEGDLANCLVVFPGKRPSHFVRKRLAEIRKSGFLAPAIFAYDELIEYLAGRLGQSRTNLDPLDAASILFEIHRSAGESIGSGHFSSFDRFLPLGFRLFDELEELALSDAGEKRIHEVVGGLTFGQRHVLATYFTEFYRTIGKHGLVTRSTKLKAVADRFASIDLSDFKSIVIAGFYALTPVDQRIFKGFLALDHVMLLFQQGPGLSRQLKHLEIEPGDGSDGTGSAEMELMPSGQVDQMNLFAQAGGAASSEKKSGSLPYQPRPPLIHLYKSSDLHGQVFALTGLMESLLSKGEPLDERTVVVLPSSEGLFPVVQQALPLLPPDGYNVSLGYPLSRTPFYAFLSSLLELAATAKEDSLEVGSYLRFVLHPYVKNIRYGTRSDVTRVLFHTIEEYLAARPSTTVRLEELESDQKIFERVARAFSEEKTAISRNNLRDHLKNLHDLVIRPFLNLGTLRHFGERTIALVQTINERSTAPLHPLFQGAARRFVEVADGIRRSLAAEEQFTSPASAVSFLRSYIAPMTVPFPGTPLRGLQVLGLLETRNLSFDRVIVLDASDGNIPGASGAEALIPQGARDTLGLETARERERLIEYYFEVLLSGAREVHLFFPENKKEEKSRFIEKYLWRRQERLGVWEDDGSVSRVQYNIHLVNPPTASIEKSGEHVEYLKGVELSATALDSYLKCPLRFYYRYVLGLREKEEAGEEIEQYDIGNIVHGILKSFFEPMVGKVLTENDLDSGRMDTLTESAFEQAMGSNLKGASLLLKRQTAGRLREFLADYQKQVILVGDVEILGIEQTVSIVKDGHHFSGRIDRIERRGDKTYILDYKIRQDDAPYKVSWRKFRVEDRETWSDAIGSVQLPMYRLLYAENSGELSESVVPVYVFLGRNQLARDIESGLSKGEDVKAEMSLEQVVLGLAAEIKDPQVPFRPTEDQKKQCPRCPYQVLCGTQWAREGRW